jgi:hypothetical protein
MKCKCNRSALAVGLFIGGLHALWALLVAIMPGVLQSVLDWIFNIHFLQPVWILTPFNFVNALLLTIVTFVMGYLVALPFEWLWKKTKVKR